MANQSLREACADILLALMPTRSAVGEARSAGYLLHGARTLRWCERFEYGDPVPASEVERRIEDAVAASEREWDDDIQAQIDEATAEADIARGIAERERDDLRKLVAPTKLAAYDKR